MYEPKKLASQLEYSGDLYLPEIDVELKDYLGVYNEHLESHKLHESLRDIEISTVGKSVILTNEDSLDESQFEEKSSKNPGDREDKKSFLKKLFK